MAYNSYTPQQPRSGFDNFGPWFSEIFQLLGARWGIWALQGLVASVPFLILGIGFAVMFFIPMMQAGNGAGRGAEFDPFVNGGAGIFFIVISIVMLLSGIWYALIFPGMVITALKQIRGEEISVGDLFSGTRFGWGYIVIGLAIGLGVFACFVGVFFTSALFCLALPILVDRKVKPGEALASSYDATKNDMWFFLLFFMVVNMVVSAAAGILNAISCGILGTLVAMMSYPIYAITMAVAYERTFNGYGGNGGTPMMQQGMPIPPPYMPTPTNFMAPQPPPYPLVPGAPVSNEQPPAMPTPEVPPTAEEVPPYTPSPGLPDTPGAVPPAEPPVE